MPRIHIGWLDAEGVGGGKGPDGATVRVPGTLPGDLAEVRLVGHRGRTSLGELTSLVQPSSDRVSPPCADDRACGGCDLSALHPARRLEVLASTVSRALRWEGRVSITPSPRPTGHRARIKLAVQGGRVGYRSAGTHDLVPFAACHIARPELQAALPPLRAWCEAHPDAALHEVELRTDGDKVVHAFASNGALPQSVRESLAELGEVALDGRRLHGDVTLHLPVGPLRLTAGPKSFYQVNLEANALLVQAVVDHVLQASPERVLDLYAGIGNLGLGIARHGVPVVAVEREGQALSDLRTSADLHGIAGVSTLAVAAERFEPSREPYDVAVLDPPRAGAGEVLGRVLRNRPRRVVYVACKVTEAARDLRQHAKGYALTSVQVFDLFPETHHLEAVLVLDRNG